MQKRNLPNRKSIRLKGWDYRNPGLYFITICTKDRQHHFGEIRDGIMGLSVPGCVAHYYWRKITEQFPSITLDKYIVMPNHVHGIVGITDSDISDDSVAMNRAPTNSNNVRLPIHSNPDDKQPGGATGTHNPMLYKNHLGRIIRWFKGRCTYEVRKRDYPEFAWQSRFYDHIIRNDKSLNRIRKYIYDNPLRWQIDRENKNSNQVHEKAVEYMIGND